MTQAFLAAVMAYVDNPGSLDTQLATLDAQRRSAYS
jgi:hypothetical protein